MRLVVVAAGIAVAVGLGTPAQADPDPDAKFLSELSSSGITYKDGPDAIGVGKHACALMDDGRSQQDVIKGMMDQNSGFTTDAATTFAQIAESVYCPQHLGGAATSPSPTTTPWSPPPFFPLPAPPAAA